MTTTQRRFVAEWDGRGWLVMDDDGQVRGFATKAEVVRFIRKTANADIDISSVEWRHADAR